MKNKKKLAKLTRKEDDCYGHAFEFYFNNVRNSNQRADRYAWKETVKAFPRLAKFDGGLS